MKKRNVVILIVSGVLGLLILNGLWVGKDEKKLYMKRELSSNQNYRDFMKAFEEKYPPGTPHSVIRTEFKDFILKGTGSYTWNKDGLFPYWYKNTSYDRFVYKLGIFGEFWVYVDYDSSEHLTDFDYDLNPI